MLTGVAETEGVLGALQDVPASLVDIQPGEGHLPLSYHDITRVLLTTQLYEDR